MALLTRPVPVKFAAGIIRIRTFLSKKVKKWGALCWVQRSCYCFHRGICVSTQRGNRLVALSSAKPWLTLRNEFIPIIVIRENNKARDVRLGLCCFGHPADKLFQQPRVIGSTPLIRSRRLFVHRKITTSTEIICKIPYSRQ